MVERSWERAMSAVFDDLEQQAEGLALVDRADEVSELSVAGYAQIALAARVHASIGRTLRVVLAGGARVSGTVACAGSDWMLVRDAQDVEWVVALAGVLTLSGASPRAVAEAARLLPDRLGLRSVLRRIAGERETCALFLVSGADVTGRLGRIGADFAEVHPEGEEYAGPGPAPTLVSLRAIAAVRGRV